jgi:methyltransferase (TIGR00027 family)
MSHSSFLPIAEIADTAFLTALYRAMESDRPDAHFHDPYARTLAGERGKQAAQQMPNSDSVALGSAVRTCILDQLILETIENHQIDLVLSLGAGLDTRAYRLSLPRSLLWCEVDLPVVLAYKASMLATAKPVCQYEAVSLDLINAPLRQQVLREITAQATRGLVITEGLLAYLPPEQVAAMARDFHGTAPLQWWLTDLSRPEALQLIQVSLNAPHASGNVKLQFAPEEGADFFAPYGWQMVAERSMFAEAQRLNRGNLPPETVAQLSPQDWNTLYQMSRFILLSRNSVI